MRKVSIEFPPSREIEVNGRRFEVKMSDFEALSLAIELSRDFGEISRDAPPLMVLEKAKKAVDAVDSLLGSGSTKKIVGDRPVDICFMLERVVLPVLEAVLEEAGTNYARTTSENYE